MCVKFVELYTNYYEVNTDQKPFIVYKIFFIKFKTIMTFWSVLNSSYYIQINTKLTQTRKSKPEG